VYLKVATTICTIYDVPQADSGRLRLSRKAGVKSRKTGVKIRSQRCISKNQKSKAGVGKAAGFWVGRMHRHCKLQCKVTNGKLESQLQRPNVRRHRRRTQRRITKHPSRSQTGTGSWEVGKLGDSRENEKAEVSGASCNFESQTHRELVIISMAVWAWDRGLEEWAWQRRRWRRTQRKNEERESR
jgi:hypothetical protein